MLSESYCWKNWLTNYLWLQHSICVYRFLYGERLTEQNSIADYHTALERINKLKQISHATKYFLTLHCKVTLFAYLGIQ